MRTGVGLPKLMREICMTFMRERWNVNVRGIPDPPEQLWTHTMGRRTGWELP